MLALPARAQDCYIPATGDAYLWADGQGTVYGYSITYNTCQDPNVYVQVYAELDDSGWYALDSGTDTEYYGNNAEVDTAATVFYAGDYYEYGAYEYYDDCGDGGWEPASPGYSEYMTWSPAPNEVPTVTSTYPDDSGGDPTWTPGGGFYNGAYEVQFSGEDLTGEIPTVSDSGCTSNSPGVPPYVVAAWQTSDSAVVTLVTVSSSLVGGCYLYASLLTAGIAAFLQGPAPPPPPPTLSVTLNGATVQAGSTVYISPTPSLPLLASLTPGSGGSLTGTATWTGNMAYTPNNFVYSLALGPVVQAATATWDIGSLLGGSFAGGSAQIQATYQGSPYSLSFTILGQNPSVATVKSAIGTNPWFIQQLANYESGGYRQFLASGYPVFGAPNGFGIMQVDYNANVYDLWTWTTNVNDGLAINAGNANAAKSAWTAQYNNWTAYNNGAAPSAQVPMYANVTWGTNPCVFSYAPSSGQYPFSDGIWIKFYNTGSGGTPFITFANGAWSTNDGQSYVSRVCSTSP